MAILDYEFLIHRLAKPFPKLLEQYGIDILEIPLIKLYLTEPFKAFKDQFPP